MLPPGNISVYVTPRKPVGFLKKSSANLAQLFCQLFLTYINVYMSKELYHITISAKKPKKKTFKLSQGF